MNEDDEFNMRVPRSEKTDWKDDVRYALVSPRFAFNMFDFMDRVESAIAIIGCQYPGWNAYKEIHAEVDKLTEKYKQEFATWCKNNTTRGKWKTLTKENRLRLELHREIWTFLKNYCGKRGMLIEGPRSGVAVDFERESLNDITK